MGAGEELGLAGVTAELPSQSQQAVHEAETAGSKGGKSQAHPGSENKEGESKAKKKVPRNREPLPWACR